MTASAAPDSVDQAQEYVRQVGRSWGWVLAFGIVSVVLGIMVLAWPQATVALIAILFAIQLIVAGIFSIVRAFSADDSTGMRVFVGILGVFAILVGLALLKNTFQTVEVMVIILGIYWVAHGIAELFGGFSGPKRQGRGWQIFKGAVTIIAGLVILLYPEMSLTLLVTIGGIWLVVMGGLEIIAAFMLRSSARKAGVIA